MNFRPHNANFTIAREDGVLALQSGGTVGIGKVLALLTRLKQICNFDSGSGSSAKTDDLRARLIRARQSAPRFWIGSPTTTPKF